jgi:quinoprotein glucose dehydrogenase
MEKRVVHYVARELGHLMDTVAAGGATARGAEAAMAISPAARHTRGPRFARLLVAGAVWLCGGLGNSAAAQQPAKTDSAAEPPATSTPEPLPPQAAPASDEAEQAMAAFRLPDDWRISLFAAEPAVANIVAFDVDHRGRVFACESFRQNRGVTDNREHDENWLKRDLAAQTVQDRIDYHLELLGEQARTYTEQDDRIRLLVDTDGDGRADRSEVFADRFNRLEDGTGAGVLVRGNEVFYTNIPALYRLVDQNGDGTADKREVMSEGYGVRVAFRGHDLHGLVMGPDGRLYFSVGDRGYHVMTGEGELLHDPASGAVFRCELDGSNLEVYARGLRNPQELAFNDYGDLFTGDNNSDSGDRARLVHVLRDSDAGWRMYYQYLPDRGPFNRDRIWEPLHDTQPAYIVPPVANFGDGPSGFTYYPGTGFGDALQDTFLLADFRGTSSNSGIRSVRLQPDGAFYTVAEDAQPIWSVLATDVAFGPDGAIYISDWVNGWNGEGKGRIYRITAPEHAGSPLVRQVRELLAGEWSRHESARLAELIGHPDRRVRYEAQWELAARGDDALLRSVAAEPQRGTLARLHAIWGLEQITRGRDSGPVAATAGQIASLLDDEDAYVRAAAAKFAGEHPEVEAAGRLVELLEDDSSRVRYFAARAVGRRGHAAAFDALVVMLAKNDNRDPALRHGGVMALAAIASPEQLAALADHSSVSVRRAAAVAMRRRATPQVARLLDDGDERVVAEAARAIHDLPITEAMPALAALIARPSENIAIVHRALNANFRLGGAENAAALARFAASAGAPEPMRLEALEMLGDWARPDERDRVLNDWRPLPERDPEAAQRALSEHLAGVLAGSEAIRNRAVSLAAELGIDQIAPLLERRLADDELSATSRAAALTAMGQLSPRVARRESLRLLAREEAPQPLRVAAIQTAAALAPQDALQQLTRIALQAEQPRSRQAAWDALATIDADAARETIRTGVSRWIAGELPADSALNVIEAAKATGEPALIGRIEDHLQQQTSEDPLARWRSALAGGDPGRGALLFFTKTELSCVRCHKVGPRGGEVGPNLTVIGQDKKPAYLLEAIVNPDAEIAKGFETTLIADDLGQTHVGIVRTETDDFVELVKADGSTERIETELIVARKRGKSSMPNDLMKYMTERELRDLVAYLVSLDEAPTTSTAEGHALE